MATIQQKIAGLYIAFFNRAADKSGLEYWEQQALALSEDSAIKALAKGFSQHTKFTDLYNGYSNKAFVESIYSNTLGQAGDTEGITYWTNLLNEGLSQSDMVAEFVSIALDFDKNNSQYINLPQADIDAATIRRDLLTNKVTVSLDFISTLSDATNLDADTDPNSASSLEADAVYQASISILADITHETSTVTTVTDALDLLADINDAITIINSLENINEQSITEATSTDLTDLTDSPDSSDSNSELQIQAADRSNINDGLGRLSDQDTTGVTSILSGEYWSSGSNTITYSFNDSIPSSYYEYEAGTELTTGWKTLSTAQREAVRDITDELNKLLGVSIEEISSGGLIQYNIIQTDSFTSGFAFFPDSFYEFGGDIFLSNEFNTLPNEYGLDPGEFGWATIAHELGHALGLEHPFEGTTTLPSSQDNINHTIMSYTSANSTIAEFTLGSESINAEYVVLEPDLYSLFDIAALQAIYGVNSSTNSSNNTYTLKYSDYSIQTIWDTGGEDIIDLSGTTGSSTIDLNAGSLNSADEHSLSDITTIFQDEINSAQYDSWIAEVISDLYVSDQLYTGLNNLAIATGSVIENITTGSGDDTITDNEVDNRIITSLGDDTIHLGSGGYDYVDGGGGSDTIYINSLLADVVIQETASNQYTVLADDFSLEFINIETLYFTDSEYLL